MHPRRTTTTIARAAAIVGSGALGASLFTGVAQAVPPASSSSAAQTAEPRTSPDAGQEPGPSALLGPSGRILHSDAVVATPSGTRTARVVVGEVTAVDERSLTVRSADGYEQMFVVPPGTAVERGDGGSTLADIYLGDRALVTGVVNASDVTADRIVAMTLSAR